jgi:hypothetical protein
VSLYIILSLFCSIVAPVVVLVGVNTALYSTPNYQSIQVSTVGVKDQSFSLFLCWGVLTFSSQHY